MKGIDHILGRIKQTNEDHPPLMTQKELDLLLTFIDEKVDIAVELGCYAGGTTEAIAKKLKSGARIYAIDIFAINKKDIYDYVTKVRFPKYPNITLIEKTTNAASVDFNKPIDFLFIDADHQDDSIQHDLRNWLPKVKIGGLVALHDYFNDDFPAIRRRAEEFTQYYKFMGQADTLLVKQKI